MDVLVIVSNNLILYVLVNHLHVQVLHLFLHQLLHVEMVEWIQDRVVMMVIECQVMVVQLVVQLNKAILVIHYVFVKHKV